MNKILQIGDNGDIPYCFLQTWLNKGIGRPFSYGSGVMGTLYQKIDAARTEAAEVPQKDVNVIFVQMESFLDPEEILGLTLSQDAVPNWHALEETCSHGVLTVPVVGAGTATGPGTVTTPWEQVSSRACQLGTAS